MTLFDFGETAAAAAFESIDDVVMGGRSRSRMRPTGRGTAQFHGTLSLERGGGFASVRSRPFSWDLSGARGLELRVRGDGRRYKVNLRTDAMGGAAAYQAAFETVERTWQTIALPFERFEARERGRAVPDAPPIDRSRVRTLGLLVADRQAGGFDLELRWIRSF